jgi:hypothetical protein
MANPQDFIGAFDPTAAEVNAAARSGAGGGKTLRFFGNLLAGLSNLRSGGLVGAGSTIVDRMSTQGYLDQLQERQRQAAMQAYWDKVNKQELEYQGRQDNIKAAQMQGLNSNGFFGTRALTAPEVGAIQQQNTIPTMNKLLQGGALEIQPGQNVTEGFIQNYLGAQKDVAQARDFAQKQLLQQFLPKPGVYAQPDAKPQGNVPMLENPLAGLQGAVSQAQVQDPITQSSPYLQYSIKPEDQIRPINAKLDRDKFNETVRSNKADEGLEAQRIAKMGSGGGGGRTPWEEQIFGMMSPEQQAAYLNSKAGDYGKPVTLDDRLKGDAEYQFMREQLPYLSGSEKTNMEKALRDHVLGVDAGERFKKNFHSMPAFGLDGLTFGGQSKQKLQGAKNNAVKGRSSSIPGLKFE